MGRISFHKGTYEVDPMPLDAAKTWIYVPDEPKDIYDISRQTINPRYEEDDDEDLEAQSEDGMTDVHEASNDSHDFEE
ncbi:hypothetical protein WAI453_000008 [Rhynchosporium graminicola]